MSGFQFKNNYLCVDRKKMTHNFFKKQSMEINIKIIQMSQLPDKDFKGAIIIYSKIKRKIHV